MKRPALWEIVFSLKAFAAGMLALYIAFAVDLEKPYWALTTAYVVAQPFSGSIRSKGVFRFGGTVIGAAVSLAIAGVFLSSDAAMLVMLTLWFCLCAYFAILDRTPRSYFFLLAGMTAVLVGWPGATISGTIFDTAIARVEEIGLGIVCTIVVDSIFFPRPIRPVIGAQVETWLADARSWCREALAGRQQIAALDRHKLAADATQLGALSVHLRYDTLENRETARWVGVLQQRMLMLLPVLSSIEDRIQELTRDGRALPERVARLLVTLDGWVAKDAPKQSIETLRQQVRNTADGPRPDSDWDDILLIGLIGRLRAFVQIWNDCRLLRDHIQSAEKPASPYLRSLARRTVLAPHRDPVLAVWSVAAAVLSFGASALFWYLTGWPQGGTAAQMSLIMCMFFGSIDDPVPMLRLMVKILCFAVVFDAIYLFVVMPPIQDFPVLMIALSVSLLPLGVLASNPATLMVALMPIAMLTVQSTASTDFAAFLNGMLATILGVAVAMVMTSLVRSIGADVSAARILKAGWRDLEAITSQAKIDRTLFTSRMLDRLGLLAPRLAAIDPQNDLVARNALSDLRLGLNLIELQRRRVGMAAPASGSVMALFKSLAGYFRALRRRRSSAPPPEILGRIDDALAAVVGQETMNHKRKVLLTLAGVRRSLFPDAPAYRSPLEAAPESMVASIPRVAAE